MKSAKNRDFSHDAARTLARATELHAEGALVEAARLYRHILRKKANHPDALHRLGVVELQTGATADALVHLRRATQLRPDDGAFLTDYGIALAASGRAANAEAILMRAVDRAPTHAPAWCNLGDARAERGDEPAAAEAYRRAIALMPAYA
ncbi:MAG: tetratricopeptide repeat protein [Alphaproteobacteria bacterium]|nr:tetratricopeptide repeat protein [Alphaproteobacteria bacterium]